MCQYCCVSSCFDLLVVSFLVNLILEFASQMVLDWWVLDLCFDGTQCCTQWYSCIRGAWQSGSCLGIFVGQFIAGDVLVTGNVHEVCFITHLGQELSDALGIIAMVVDGLE